MELFNHLVTIYWFPLEYRSSLFLLLSLSESYLVLPDQTRHVRIRRDRALKVDVVTFFDRVGIQFWAQVKTGKRWD